MKTLNLGLIAAAFIFMASPDAFCQPGGEHNSEPEVSLAPTASIAAGSDISATQPTPRYYLVSEVMDTRFNLWRLRIMRRIPWVRNQSWVGTVEQAERFLWYASVPALIIGHGLPFYVATGDMTAMILPIGIYVPKVFALLLAKTAMRLKAEAWVTDQWHMSDLDNLPGVKRVLRLNGQLMIDRKRVVDELHSRQIFVIEMDANAPPPPPDYTVDIHQNGELVKAELIEIPSTDDFQVTLSLQGVPGEENLPKWNLSFGDLMSGIKPDEELRKLWWHHAEENFNTAKINMSITTGGTTKDLGPLASLQGVGSFLGHGMINHELFWIPLAYYNLLIRKLNQTLARPDIESFATSKEQIQSELDRAIGRRDRIRSWSSTLASWMPKKMQFSTFHIDQLISKFKLSEGCEFYLMMH